jgi:membrane protease YdiL (CAAX protease family)
MSESEHRQPWNPHRSWADPLITLLALLALMAAWFTLSARREAFRHPSERVSLQGRLTEVALMGQTLLPGPGGKGPEWGKVESQLKEPWDRALLAVLKAEGRDQGEAASGWIDQAAPAGPGGPAFRRVCLAAYAEGPPPSGADREDIRRRLGRGYAADLLEARLLDRDGQGAVLRARARTALMRRLVVLGLLGLLVLGTATAGLIVGIYLVGIRKQAPRLPLPPWALSGRAAALVLLAWFLTFFLSSSLVGLLLHPWPGARWMAGPLSYLFHAGVGITLLSWAEGIPFPDLWRRVAPSRIGRDLAWGGAFLALAVLLVLVVALVSGWVLQPDQNPQRDLQELLRGLSGWGPSLVMFLTVAGLAPFFEELLFRGFLLPVLARRQPMAAALVGSALIFGAIHLQPAGLPILSTLGLVLGLAMRHSGSLRTPMLVHACWNGSLFLLIRGFA